MSLPFGDHAGRSGRVPVTGPAGIVPYPVVGGNHEVVEIVSPQNGIARRPCATGFGDESGASLSMPADPVLGDSLLSSGLTEDPGFAAKVAAPGGSRAGMPVE